MTYLHGGCAQPDPTELDRYWQQARAEIRQADLAAEYEPRWIGLDDATTEEVIELIRSGDKPLATLLSWSTLTDTRDCWCALRKLHQWHLATSPPSTPASMAHPCATLPSGSHCIPVTGIHYWRPINSRSARRCRYWWKIFRYCI